MQLLVAIPGVELDNCSLQCFGQQTIEGPFDEEIRDLVLSVKFSNDTFRKRQASIKTDT